MSASTSGRLGWTVFTPPLAAIVLVVAPVGSAIEPAVQAVDLVVAGVAGAAAATFLGIAGGVRHRRRRAR